MNTYRDFSRRVRRNILVAPSSHAVRRVATLPFPVGRPGAPLFSSTIIYKGLYDGSISFSQLYGRRIRCIFTALVLVLAACYGRDPSHFTSVASDDVVSRFGS